MSRVIFSLVSLWFSVSSVSFFIILLVALIILLLVGFNGGLDEEELFIRLDILLVNPFWNFETWVMKSSNIWRRWALMCKQPGEISVFST